MARRSGGSHKTVEEKRRSLPIYQHYTLSPGKTKSHHPEAKCNHCLKEFVCGSKQRLIRHLRKCNRITNPDQIIAETLNTLARNSATGALNHTILEASNLLPSQISHLSQQNNIQHHHHHHHHQNLNNSDSLHNNGVNNTSNSSGYAGNHTLDSTGGSGSELGLMTPGTSNGSASNSSSSGPTKRPYTRRGRRPGTQSLLNSGPAIHVTTGSDGKTQFTPASQLPPNIASNVVAAAPIITQVHNGRRNAISFAYPSNSVAANSPLSSQGISRQNACVASVQHHSSAHKLNTESIDKAYLKLVLTRNLPLSLCDTKEFHSWVKTFANDYKPPSSINLIQLNLRTEANAAKIKISNILAKASKKTINLELHQWYEPSRQHSWYVIIANLDFKKFLISIKKIDDAVNDSTVGSLSNQDATMRNNGSVHETIASPPLAIPQAVKSNEKQLSEFINDCIRRINSDRVNSLIFSSVNAEACLASKARELLYADHPSIVTYDCWWQFTYLICSDIVQSSQPFKDLMRDANRLISFICKRPRISGKIERFSPFQTMTSITKTGGSGDSRFYSHLVCYMLEYLKNNHQDIVKLFSNDHDQTELTHLSSDTNNNNSSITSNGTTRNSISSSNNSTMSTQNSHRATNHINEDVEFAEINNIITSSDFWTNLDKALALLKPIRDIVALTSITSTQSTTAGAAIHQNCNNSSSISSNDPPSSQQTSQSTPVISKINPNNVSLSDYMSWFLNYGKTLLASWKRSQDGQTHQLIRCYLNRFTSFLPDFKLLFAAYLLNPEHKCAYMTSKAKDVAIEEILTIASEFMPEETAGHTIFDQWKLYLVREEPYDLIYDPARTNPLEWWMSLPCAESIRRVALRILRLRAMTSPRSETLFPQLYFYEDEARMSLNDATFEDVAVLRYFYDFEDKIGQAGQSSSLAATAAAQLPGSQTTLTMSSNQFQDRASAGNLHAEARNHVDIAKICPSGGVDSLAGPEMNGSGGGSNNLKLFDSMMQGINDATSNSATADCVGFNRGDYIRTREKTAAMNNTMNLENLPGYSLFASYIDFDEQGVQIVEEPIEKKKRKWTAREILSKCQSN